MTEAHGIDSIKDENTDIYEGMHRNMEQLSPVQRITDHAVVQKSEVWDRLRKEYEAGSIGSLVELRTKLKEQTGLAVSTMTLSRRIRSKDKRLERKGKYLPDVFNPDGGGENGPTSSREEQCYRSLSRRLCSTVMTVKEGSGVRQYTRTRLSPDGLKEYFRCNRCYFQKCKFGGGPVATVAAYQGNLIGNKHPKHHDNCHLVGVASAAVTAVDRESRREVRDGQKDPKEAHNEAFAKTLQMASSLSAHPGGKLSLTTMFPPWQRVRKSYYRHKRNGFHGVPTMHDESDDVENADTELDCGQMMEVESHADGYTATINEDLVDVVGVFPSPCVLKRGRPVEKTSSANPSDMNMRDLNRYPAQNLSVLLDQPNQTTTTTTTSKRLIRQNQTTTNNSLILVHPEGRELCVGCEQCSNLALTRQSKAMEVVDGVVSVASRPLGPVSGPDLVSGLDLGSGPVLGPSSRRHYVFRDRRTGHITVCTRPPRGLLLCGNSIELNNGTPQSTSTSNLGVESKGKAIQMMEVDSVNNANPNSLEDTARNSNDTHPTSMNNLGVHKESRGCAMEGGDSNNGDNPISVENTGRLPDKLANFPGRLPEETGGKLLDTTVRKDSTEKAWTVMKSASPILQTTPAPIDAGVQAESCSTNYKLDGASDTDGVTKAQLKSQQNWMEMEENSVKSLEPWKKKKHLVAITRRDELQDLKWNGSKKHKTTPKDDGTKKEQDDDHYQSETRPSVEKDLGAMRRDRFVQMGESIADSLRGVYEVNCDAGDRLQSEILQVMTKYKKSNTGPDHA